MCLKCTLFQSFPTFDILVPRLSSYYLILSLFTAFLFHKYNIEDMCNRRWGTLPQPGHSHSNNSCVGIPSHPALPATWLASDLWMAWPKPNDPARVDNIDIWLFLLHQHGPLWSLYITFVPEQFSIYYSDLGVFFYRVSLLHLRWLHWHFPTRLSQRRPLTFPLPWR